MVLVKIIKKTKNKIEQAKVVLSIFCLLSDIKLSDKDLTVLAYYIVYGIGTETDLLIVKSQIQTAFSLNNTKSKLKKFGLINKKSKNHPFYINEKIDIKPESQVGMIIKIDNK